MITIKPIASYYSADDHAVIARTAELVATGKRRRVELAEVDVAIATQGDIAPNPEDQVQNLISGIDIPRPQRLDERRAEFQRTIRDIDQALDFMAGKERQIAHKAGARLAKDIKPQVDKAEKELADALVVAHDKHLIYWSAKRHLINTGIGTHGLFASDVDNVLGIPVGIGSPLAGYFFDAVKNGHLKSAPESFH